MTLSSGFLLLGFALAPLQAPPTAEDLAQGERLYKSQCGSCHGPRGDGGKGANLARPRLPRAPDDRTLSMIIRRGIRGTEMPGSILSPTQARQIGAFVRTLGEVEQFEIPGDPGRGEEIYASLDCAQCHTVRGQGGSMGPDLDDIGARRSAAHIREALTDPEASVPTGFLQVRLLTKDEREITAVRINEDAFSIQVRDLRNRFHSFWKDELRALERDWGRSPMVSYGTMLTSEQIDDLVAYLVSLQGRP